MNKPKKIPMRKCVITGERFPKNELIRIVRTPEGNVVIDLKGKANGRGAYVSKSLAVVGPMARYLFNSLSALRCI